jgi:tetratricopeptide (TPR) repeat protein
MCKYILYLFITFISHLGISQCNFQKLTTQQEEISAKSFKNSLWYGDIFNPKIQLYLDSLINIDSTIAQLWQHKAMALFKQGKYELGMPFLDKAVKFDSCDYIGYRGFMKCIFAKQYKSAIIDFTRAEKIIPNGMVMDHSHKCYIAISYLMLNEFKKAEKILTKEYKNNIGKGEIWVHHLDIFYLGISQYEQEKYDQAIKSFDLALKRDDKFSDAQFYKSKSLLRKGDTLQAINLFKKAKQNHKDGYGINEDNTFYERYPYQVNWHHNRSLGFMDYAVRKKLEYKFK